MALPLVSVIMAVHNGAPHLRAAVDSVLGQTWRALELVVVNDGSDDDSGPILAEYTQRDVRLRVFTQDRRGLAAALNRGLVEARGEYVARMDADDVSLPSRLAKQVAYLQAQREVGVCGTWLKTIGERVDRVWRYPTDDATIRCRLLFDNALAHPTVMLRRAVFAQGGLVYDPTYRYAQDYDLWARAARVCKLANLPQALVRYRRHGLQASQHHVDEQNQAAQRVREQLLRLLDPAVTAAEINLHEAVSRLVFRPARASVSDLEAWLIHLRSLNAASAVYPEPAFSEVLAGQWYQICNAALPLGQWIARRFSQSALVANLERRRWLSLKLTVKLGLRRQPQPEPGLHDG